MRALLLLLGILAAQATAWADGLLVIAHPDVPAERLSLDELAAIYLIQTAAWKNGTPVVPVNREVQSAVRERFSEDVFDRPPQELAEYWNRLRFQGKIPPLVQTSDQAVLKFVRNVPGAVGYIQGSEAPADVRVLAKLP